MRYRHLVLSLGTAVALLIVLGWAWPRASVAAVPSGSASPGGAAVAKAAAPLQGTPTPTLTPIGTPTQTPTPLACSANADYTLTQSTGATVVTGTLDIGNHCDDCTTTITLPFAYQFYDRYFTTAHVGSNGTLEFLSSATPFTNACLPFTGLDYAILPHWDDLNTSADQACPTGCGIFTAVSGSAPNRIFDIEWRALYFGTTTYINFEVQLYEGQPRADVVYGAGLQGGSSATVGVQKDSGSHFTQFECNTGGLATGLRLMFVLPPCSPLPTPTHPPPFSPTPGTPSATPTCAAAGTLAPWVTTSPVASPEEAGGMDSDGTYAYVAGGYNLETATMSTQFARFSPGTGVWTYLAPVPDSINGMASVVYSPINNKLYVFGGMYFAPTQTLTNTNRIYDIAAGTWSTGAPLPDIRAFMASGYYNGKIYLVAGYNTPVVSSAQAQVWEYDPIANTYTTTRMPIPHAVGGAGYGIINGHLYVAGGRDAANAVLDLVWDYNIAADTWTARAPLPAPNNVPGSAVLGGQLWQFGGGNPFSGAGGPQGTRDSDAPATTNATVIYNPGTDTWMAGPSLNLPRSFPGGTHVGNTVIAVGGSTGSVTTGSTEISVRAAPCPNTPTATATNTRTAVPLSATATSTRTAVPPTATPAPPTATPAPPLLVAGGPGDQQAPRISHHLLVYEDDAAGTWDIFVKDVSTAAPPSPVYQGPGDQRAPDISGDLVVWQDNRNGTWDIYGRHLNGGADFPIFTGPGDQTHPHVNGTQVVWENTLTPGATSIVALDLAGGPSRTLSDPGTTNLHPDLDNNFVVWQSAPPTTTLKLGAASAGWQIVSYDFTTQLTRTLSTGLGDHTAPSISGNSVVWVTTQPGGTAGAGPGAPDNSNIDAVDVRRGGGGTPFPVTTPVPNKSNSEPRVRGRDVAYIDEDSSARAGTVVSTNLDTGQTVVHSSAGHDARNPDIDDDGNLVWRQPSGGSGGDTDIYGTYCPPTVFSDVLPADYFAGPVGWLTCIGAISGYSDGTFRPYAETTRGQLTKIVVGARGWAIDTTGGPHFGDVPASNPFYAFIETAFNHGIISGYSDGSFRWGANVTRGQLSKIVVGAQGWTINTTGGPHFSDVPAANPFYAFVETAFNHGIISGYADGTFRVGANATRGQIAKIVYIAATAP